MPSDRTNRSLHQINLDSVLQPMTSIAEHLASGPMIITGGSGVRIRDDAGREYIDAIGSLWCVNAGYGREEIARAGYEILRDLGSYHTFTSMSNEPITRLADRILTLLREEAGQDQMSKVFFGNSGSDANDSQVKIVRYYNNLRGRPEKKKIIAREGGYHGVTVAAGSLTGIPMYHRAFDLPIDGVFHVSAPHYRRFANGGETEDEFSARLAKELEDLILREGPETIAAFIAEPVMGTGGVVPPPAGYFTRIEAILRKYDILFIADEVITGFGRLGSWFGCGHYGLKPDLLTFAKGVTSGYFPLSGVVMSEKVWEVLRDASPEMGAFAHGFTYSGHPLGGAIGCANLEIISRENLVANAATIGRYFRTALNNALGDHPMILEIRGEGLMIGVEYQPAERTTPLSRQVVAAARDEGLILRALPFGDVNAFAPPLTFSSDDADETVARFTRALSRVLA